MSSLTLYEWFIRSYTPYTLKVEEKSTDTSRSGSSSKCRRLSIVAEFQSSLIHDPKNRHFVICFHCLFSRSFWRSFSRFLFPFFECIVDHVISNHQIEWNAVYTCIQAYNMRSSCSLSILSNSLKQLPPHHLLSHLIDLRVPAIRVP